MTREWYFQAMGQELGPLSVAELKSKVANGQIQPDTLVRKGPEGKWVFGMNVKGLFAAPAEPPPPPPPPPSIPPSVAKPKSSATTIPVGATIPAASIAMVEDESDSEPHELEFYDFVGFREAISPMLHDAVKRFASHSGITIGQLNRRALANFIQRPELASDLLITGVAGLPQPVNLKSNQDGRDPSSDGGNVEVAMFRFALFNSSHNTIHVSEGAFVPQSIEERSDDSVVVEPHPEIDHTGQIEVRLDSAVIGKAIRLTLDVSIPPEATRDIVVWFHTDSKSNLIKTHGQLLINHGVESAMSEPFTVILHGDGVLSSE